MGKLKKEQIPLYKIGDIVIIDGKHCDHCFYNDLVCMQATIVAADLKDSGEWVYLAEFYDDGFVKTSLWFNTNEILKKIIF